MPHARVRALRGLLLSVAMIGLCGGEAAALVVLDDGGTHVINGVSPGVLVRDSPSGATTKLTIVAPADVGGEENYSVDARAQHGGKAVVELLGGALEGYLSAGGGSCITISGGSIGQDDNGSSVRATGAVLDISGGTFSGALKVGLGSRASITGGVFGMDTTKDSMTAEGQPYGNVFVEISNITFPGSLRADGESRVYISDSFLGWNDGFVSACANPGIHLFDGVSFLAGTTVMGITQSSLGGTLLAFANSEVSISASSVGGAVPGPDARSVIARATYNRGPAVVDIASGTFTRGVEAGNTGRVRIASGSFGLGGPVDSLTAVTASSLGWQSGKPDTAVVEIFGGTFTSGLGVGGLKAGKDGIIHVYGHGLSIDGTSGLLTGTLANGTPISTLTSTSDNGQFILHQVMEIAKISLGYSLMHTQSQGVSTLWLPPDLSPPPTGCPLGAIPVAMAAVPLGVMSLGGSRVDVGQASMVVQRLSEATNPDGGRYQDTIPIELVALQLQSVEPMDLEPLGGTGTDYLFLTLQADRGLHLLDPAIALDSTGEMTIDFAMRTYDSFLNVYFDVRAGSPDGEILFSGNDTLVATQVPWAVDLPEGWSAIEGLDDAFFAGVIGGSLVGFDQAGEFLQLRMATVLVPEPTTLTLLGLGIMALLRRRRAPRAGS